jgi:hypothetical protein
MARTILLDSNLTKTLWAEAVNYATYTKNRLPHSAINNKTPFEVFLGKPPTIVHLQAFGKTAYIHIPEEIRKPGSKLEARAQKGQLVGYGERICWYRFWTGKNVTILQDYNFSKATEVEDGPGNLARMAKSKDIIANQGEVCKPRKAYMDLSNRHDAGIQS